MLRALVRWLRPKVVVEVGTYFGYSATWLARGLQENGEGRLYCIDDWSLSGPEAVLACAAHLGMCQVHPLIELVNGKSAEVEWPEDVDLAYIDGDHSFAAVVGDVSRAIEAGASCIVLHDVGEKGWEGPQRLVAEWPHDGWDLLEAYHGGGLAILKRREVRPQPMFTEAAHAAGHV
jgi:predicted O-methyltransferase YrrM